MDNYIPRINPILRRKCTEIVDEYTKTLLPEIRYSGITSALAKVSISHGKTRREALRELDRVVTSLFPSVEGAPLPSEELNGVADVLAGGFVTYDGAVNAFGIGRYPSDYARFDIKF